MTRWFLDSDLVMIWRWANHWSLVDLWALPLMQRHLPIFFISVLAITGIRAVTTVLNLDKRTFFLRKRHLFAPLANKTCIMLKDLLENLKVLEGKLKKGPV